jgi:Tfp pilus assembly protein PilF
MFAPSTLTTACLDFSPCDDVLSDVCRALRVDPRHVPSLSSLGLLILEHRGNVEEAESLYKRALDIDPNDLGTLFNYGILLQVKYRLVHENYFD